MINFHNISLPDLFSSYSSKTIIFDNNILSTISGREIRSNYSKKLKTLYVLDVLLNEDEFLDLERFFICRNGRKYSFKFKDRKNYIANKEFLPKTTERNIHLNKTYYDFNGSYLKHVMPIKGTVKLYLNNRLMEDYEIDYCKSLIKLNSALNLNDTLHGSFQFENLVRFNTDKLEYKITDSGAIWVKNLELIEVINE